jgi:hypothetical protein
MIENNESQTIGDVVSSLERRNRRLTWGFRVLLVLWMATLSVAFVMRDANANLNITQDSVLHVRGLVVVDENGTERVQIGAPLPDPLILGRRYRRLGAISGILLMDAEGNERSGYVTSDAAGEVFLTLDTVAGQTAMFYANPHTGAHLQMADHDHGNSLRLFPMGNNPHISMTRQGQTVFRIPEAGGNNR